MPEPARESPAADPARSVDADEIARFAALAESWWDAEGPLKPLHALNPIRLGLIRDWLARRTGRDPLAVRPLAGLRVLDVGCGGGLVCEPLCRLGASVTGIDAAEANLRVAREHARAGGLEIDYRTTSAEALSESGETFDAVLALEIVEHVADLPGFVTAGARLVAPGGAFVGATLNRTPQSLAFAILGAEYLFRWLPRGTHDWTKFVRPSEFVRLIRREGLEADELVGIGYRPIAGVWTRCADLSVNYMLAAHRPSGRGPAGEGR